ncbi:hypothetical protein [Streptomyces sp. NPDC058084]|uniref:hypothetical protein n=1 Tax=Streptomyces sp. NPDC058084 TaxID=3346333 RepID=UPI0036EA84FA
MGTALLLAAAPAGRGRAIDAASVLPALAAVPAGALAGTDMATVVELADPLDPQTVLTRLRAAAASPGPLALYLAGQLQLDRRQQLPHLALARSTPTTLRYTGLPWHWLAAELAPRRPGTTTVVADLAADPELWQRLAADRNALNLGQAVPLYARITPFPRRGALLAPDYLRHFATLWRTGVRPPLPTLHAEAAEAAAAVSESESLLLAPSLPAEAAPTVAPLPQPFGAVALVDSPPTRRLGGAGLAQRAASLGAQRAGAVATPPATSAGTERAPGAPFGSKVMPPSATPAATARIEVHGITGPATEQARPATSVRASSSARHDAPTGDAPRAERQGTTDAPEPEPGAVAARDTSAGREIADEGPRRGAGEPAAGPAVGPAGSVASAGDRPVTEYGEHPEPTPDPPAEAEPEPEPEPTSEPRRLSTPETTPDGNAEPAPTARPEPTVEPQPQPQPQPQQQPQPERLPEPEPEPQRLPEPQPQPRPIPEPYAAHPERVVGVPPHGPAAGDAPKPVSTPAPLPAPVAPSPPVSVPPRPAYAPRGVAAPETPRRHVPGSGAAAGTGPDGPPRPGSEADPHPAILSAAMAGRHGEAAAMAAAWESDALRRYGPRSGEALHWVEVRADLARLAGEPARSCELWIAAAQARLGLRQGPDEPDVEGAVDRAHHQWEQIRDPARARALGPALVELRRAVPGRRAGALAALQRRTG